VGVEVLNSEESRKEGDQRRISQIVQV